MTDVLQELPAILDDFGVQVKFWLSFWSPIKLRIRYLHNYLLPTVSTDLTRPEMEDLLRFLFLKKCFHKGSSTQVFSIIVPFLWKSIHFEIRPTLVLLELVKLLKLGFPREYYGLITIYRVCLQMKWHVSLKNKYINKLNVISFNLDNFFTMPHLIASLKLLTTS